MNITRRRGAIAFSITFGICLAGMAIALNVGWIILNVHQRRIAYLVLGIILFGVLIAGVILNTIFIVREIRRNERQESFLNAVTHELKTPIASIRLYLETLQMRPLSEEQRREFYARMMEDNDRLLGTVEQILRAGEAGAKGVKRNPGGKLPVDLRGLTLECLAEIRRRHHLPEQATQFEDLARNQETFVSGDAESLRTAIRNVLDNAVKYSTHAVHITVELSILDGKQMMLRFTDTGMGIAPAQLKRIFYRFYRATNRDSTRVKGTGLGLFIVRAILREHGGEATAQSFGAGRGTTITLQLPRLLQTGAAQAAPREALSA